MFALIRDRQRFNERSHRNCSVYACTVGLRPSHAGYYLSEMAELRQLLKALQVGCVCFGVCRRVSLCAWKSVCCCSG
eukprot:3822434-Rhodomonas_salina.6